MSRSRLQTHRKLFPLFHADERMQHLRLAMWLHKLQAAALLRVLDGPQGSKTQPQPPRFAAQPPTPPGRSPIK